MQLSINHPSGKVTLNELKADIQAARKQNLILAFTPDTVESLINSLDSIALELNGIAEDDMTKAEKNILNILLGK